MKNLLRTAKRELDALEKKQNKFNGSGVIEVFLIFPPYDGKPERKMHLTTIKGIPKGIYQSITSKFNGGKK